MPSPPPARGMSGLQKAVVGCAIGCGALVILGVIGAGIGGWWFVHPGRQQRTEAVVSPAATGSFTFADLAADPGVTALLDAFMLETQRQQQQEMPDWMRQMQQMGQAGSSPSAGLRWLLPKQATLSLEPSGSGADTAVVLAVNPRGFTRFVELLLRQGESPAESYRAQQLYRVGNDGWATRIDGTVLVASEQAALRTAIDRMLDGSAAATVATADLGAPARSWDASGVVDGREQGLARELWGDEPPPAGVGRTHLGVDVATRDTAVGRVAVDCDSPQTAALAAIALERRAGERAGRLAERGLTLRATSRVAGQRALLDWELAGLDAALAQWMAATEQSSASDVGDE